MADKQDRWLDRETAERLLRGESPENAVAPEAHDQAERLARTLAALSALGAEPLRADEELPGEAAALKAFSEARAARESPAGSHASPQSRTSHPSAYPGDAGLVRIGGRTGADRNGERAHRRWSRPLRLGLAAAVAVGMLGGVAVAAGTGVLPSPFDGAGPEPGASVSSAASPDRASASPSPDTSGGVPDAVAPDGGTDRDSTGSAKGTDGSSAAPGARSGWPKGVTSACREIEAGRTLGTQRRRTLEGLAGGRSRVTTYCAHVLENGSGRTTGDGQDDSDQRNSWGDDDSGTGRGGHDEASAGLSVGPGTGYGQDDDHSGGTGSDDDGGAQNGGYGGYGGGDNGGNGGSGRTGHH
ncbi:hypothetical protein ABZ490_31695 [Streptomyces sp. NPDC005811]|uniref:hypothetical protein n=1 Tax=Streptomyces sp. NPDC005811 TaxID=3154565 RepID=UPI0033E830F1